jgi:acyl-CoA synthetase (AMP-forming)/AMP-acid ligase II
MLRHQLPFPPLMHGAGQWAMCRTLIRGGPCTLIRDVSFDPEYALEVLAREEVNIVWAAGDAHARPVLDAIEANHGGSLDLPKLTVWITGAVMITPEIKAGITRALPGTIVFDAIGASETGAQGQGRGYSEEGSPRFAMDEGALILDDDHRPIPKDDPTIGHLAKGGHIPLGYYKDEAKTAATFFVVDGERYAVPGDLARWEPDGTVTVFGRGSVSINTGGEKVFPEEVEKALKTHPAIFDAIVVGTPDERFGKRVTAVVQLRTGRDDPGLEALADHCRKLLAGYKAPRALVVEETIVRSPSGKPDYRWALDVATAALDT